ncbi:MAG: hypothetical protein K0Q49_1689 [Haloplasmataceae bacterium]|jgi:hypothetical protein|nr:hypothetical protein [Haloplasmataceae bacterium]
MFSINLKKDWKMHKSLLISFLAIAFVAFLIIFAIYLVLKFLNTGDMTKTVLTGIWSLVTTLVMVLSSILPIVLMFKVLKNDLGKNNIQYTIFTPQSLVYWYLPKVLFVFIIQGLFTLLELGFSYLLIDATNIGEVFDLTTYVLSFLAGTFSFGFFGLLTLTMAIYYSFRKKGLSWTLIVTSIICYFIPSIVYSIITTIDQYNQAHSGKIDVDINTSLSVSDIFIPYGLDSAVGLVMILIAFYLLNKKIEY